MTKLANFFLLFASIAVTAYALDVERHANSLKLLADALHARDVRKWELQCRHQILAREVAIVARRELYFEESLRDTLKACKTREDFPVREGPWTVIGVLKTVDKQSQRIGIYLPAGDHILKFATETFPHDETKNKRATHPIFDDRPSKPEDIQSLRLMRTPEVFELRTFWNLEGGVATVRLEVLGNQNSIIFKHTQDYPADRVNVYFPLNSQFRTVAYPSELVVDEDTKHKLASGHRPYIRLLDLGVSASHTAISAVRMWIESDDPPCIAALEVARQLEQVEQLLGIRSGSLQLEASTPFLPYNSSGRYIIRPSMFHRSSEQYDGSKQW